MIESKAWHEAEKGRLYREIPDLAYYRVGLFESPAAEGLAPQAFAIEQEPGWELKAHFHVQHQFQVISQGAGTLGRHAVRPFMVHYAAPETAYGPIKGGPDGVTYHTLRAVRDNSSWYVEKHRDKLIAATRAGAKRKQVTSEPFEPSEPQALKQRREIATDDLIAASPDGMGVWALRLPPGARAMATHRPVGGPRYYFVAGGTMRVGNETLNPRSVTFTSLDEEGFEIVAGSEGLEVIVMQFPRDVGTGPTVQPVKVQGELVGAAPDKVARRRTAAQPPAPPASTPA